MGCSDGWKQVKHALSRLPVCHSSQMHPSSYSGRPQHEARATAQQMRRIDAALRALRTGAVTTC